MNLTRVEVSNFKGIDSLTFEPGQVTLLTGRNNSGKTSLLEAVELAVDPSRIEQYGVRVESLIAAGAESAEITLEFEDDGSVETRELELLVSEEDQLDLISFRTGKNTNWNVMINKEIRRRTGLDQTKLKDGGGVVLPFKKELEKLSKESRKQLQNTVLDLWKEEHNNSAVSAVQLNSNSGQYTYTYTGEYVASFSDVVSETVARSSLEQLDTETVDKIESRSHSEDLLRSLYESIRYLVERRFQGGKLFPDSPDNLASVGFRDELALTADEIDLGENDGAIRLSNIEEYLIENSLVENLDTLSLDQMVYEEDGEKYQVPYEFVGEGVKTLLGLLWELWEDTPELLLLEEPETHMHPRYVHEFVHWFVDVVRDRDVQVFLTTHDIDTIRSFFDFVEPSQKAFLREEFRLVQMDQTLPESYDYDEAESLSKELQTDLRGI